MIGYNHRIVWRKTIYLNDSKCEVVSLAEAKSLGLKRYFTGEPCLHGHTTQRFVCNKGCMECGRHVDRRLRLRHAETIRARDRLRYRRNPAPKRVRAKLWRKKNLELKRAIDRRYAADNADQARARIRKWKKDNPSKLHHQIRLRRLRKQNRTPDWADVEAIRFFYECCPKGCHVDHVIPLKGERISGLHVETNLQWLPAKINQTKNNRWKS